MAMKVERTLPFPVEAEEVCSGQFRKPRNLYDLICEAQAIQFRSNPLRTLTVVISRGILARNPYQIFRERQDVVFAAIERLRQCSLMFHRYSSTVCTSNHF